MWKKWISGASLMWCATLGFAAPAAPWPDAPFSYYANNARLDNVLREFAGNFSMSAQLTPAVTGMVNGRFNTASPTEFINRLSSIYGFTWFTYSGTLYVSKSTETVTRGITAAGSISGAREALTSLGIIDPRFGWGEMPDQGVALVSGPPAYVDLIERTMKSLPLGGSGQQVMVFRLRHASVDDRTIMYRDREITTPGLATVIRNLFNGGDGPVGVTNTTLRALAAPLRSAAPLVEDAPANGDTNTASAPATPQRTSRGRQAGRPTIQADSRINALIVQDIPERLPMYERLIRELDVPTALIEIEALIIDINSDKLKELGISWGGRIGKVAGGYGNLNNNDSQGISIGAAVSGAINPTTLLVDAGNYLISRIHALEGEGDAHIQSSPSILTIDNVGALLDLSETFYIRTLGERVASVTPVTAGTTLKVTPRYLSGESGTPSVQLTVDIEDGQIQDRQVDMLPTVRRSVVSTQAIVGENQTLLIGGYNTLARTERDDGVPGLKNIPILGALFSTRSSSFQKRERLFMIKPKIISSPTMASAAPVVGPGDPLPSGTELKPESRGKAPGGKSARPDNRKMPAAALPAAAPASGVAAGATTARPALGPTTLTWHEDIQRKASPLIEVPLAPGEAGASGSTTLAGRAGTVTGLQSSTGAPIRMGSAER
ncbi:type III secretion system outer membrane ring subunit SctC [Imbroritus primus]|uniref:type III secretion system outer membrane ring subunit SctC n=1 Tax=Imbroritus primus TaxID=3058603 RepID=UPI003D161E61